MTHFINRMPLTPRDQTAYPKCKMFCARLGRVKLATVQVRDDGAIREAGMLSWLVPGSDKCFGRYFEQEQQAWEFLRVEAEQDVKNAEHQLKLAKGRLKRFMEKHGGKLQ